MRSSKPQAAVNLVWGPKSQTKAPEPVRVGEEGPTRPPLWLHAAAALFLLHLVLFLIRKGKLPSGSCIRDKALRMSGPNQDSTFCFLK